MVDPRRTIEVAVVHPDMLRARARETMMGRRTEVRTQEVEQVVKIVEESSVRLNSRIDRQTLEVHVGELVGKKADELKGLGLEPEELFELLVWRESSLI